MSKMFVRTRAGTFMVELERSDLGDELWLSLPFEGRLNMLGDQIYFEMPLDTIVKGDLTILETGDVAYWPQAKALCLFFGATPLSGDDGRPVSAYPVKRIGRLLGDFSALEKSGDGSVITLDRAF